MRKPEQIEIYKLAVDLCCFKAGEYVEVRVRRDYVEIEVEEGIFLKILNGVLDAYFVDEEIEEELENCNEELMNLALEEYRDGKINFHKCHNILKQILKR